MLFREKNDTCNVGREFLRKQTSLKNENKEEKVTETQIIQVQTMMDECSKILSLGRAHMLYQIHAPSNMQQAGSISICALDSKMFGPYSFRSKSSLGWNHHGQIHTFQTRKSGEDLRCCSAIGAIRLLITKNEYDKARALVHEVGMEAFSVLEALLTMNFKFRTPQG